MRLTSYLLCNILWAEVSHRSRSYSREGDYYKDINFRRDETIKCHLGICETEFSNNFAYCYNKEFQWAMNLCVGNIGMQLKEPLSDIREVEICMLNYCKDFCIIGAWD